MYLYEAVVRIDHQLFKEIQWHFGVGPCFSQGHGSTDVHAQLQGLFVVTLFGYPFPAPFRPWHHFAREWFDALSLGVLVVLNHVPGNTLLIL